MVISEELKWGLIVFSVVCNAAAIIINVRTMRRNRRTERMLRGEE